ncbi:MAG: ion transporter [Planctomycetota bacterium]
MQDTGDRSLTGWRARGHEVIFESDTPAGKAFDVALIAAIVASTAAVMLESVAAVSERHGALLQALEWAFTVIFTVEYGLRLLCVGRPARYARSFFGVVDLLAILPTYLSLIVPGAQYLLVIRTLRILRVFRILKLVHYLHEIETLSRALRASMRKIFVFVFAVLVLVVILGSLMYLIEGPEHGFTSIPRGVYWAIVTLTTVGYGDISPQTATGQTLASFIMILGYGIIAVPTGIVTAELTHAGAVRPVSGQACPQCSAEGHDADAVHCKFCGARL